MTENAAYVANFQANSYTITANANPTAGGTITGAGAYNYGSTCTLTATANTGYTFVNWTNEGTVVGTNPTYSFTVTGNTTYVANFQINSYTITATADPAGGGTISGAGTYNYGDICSLSVTTNPGYTFVNWTKNGTIVATSPNYNVTVYEDASYHISMSTAMRLRPQPTQRKAVRSRAEACITTATSAVCRLLPRQAIPS